MYGNDNYLKFSHLRICLGLCSHLFGSGGLGGGLVSRKILSVLCEARMGFELVFSKISRSL